MKWAKDSNIMESFFNWMKSKRDLEKKCWNLRRTRHLTAGSQPPKCYWYYHWKQQKSPPILSGLQLPLASLILSGTISLCTLASDCLYRACWKHVLIIHFFHIIVVEDQTVIEIRQVHCSCTWIIYCFVFKTVWAYIDTDMVRRNSRRLIQAAEIFNCILYREKG